MNLVFTELGEGHATYQPTNVAGSLRTTSGGGGIAANLVTAFNPQGGNQSLQVGDDVAPTLKVGSRNAAYQAAVAIGFDPQGGTMDVRAGDPSPTIADSHVPAVLAADVPVRDLAFTLADSRGTGDGHGNGWNSNYLIHRPLGAAVYGGGDCSGSRDVVAPTLTAKGGTGRQDFDTEAFVVEPDVIAGQCHGNNVGPMGTLRTGNGGLTGGVPFIVNAAESCAKKSHARPTDTARCLEANGSFATNQGGTVVCVTGTHTHALTAKHASGEDGTGRGTPPVVYPDPEDAPGYDGTADYLSDVPPKVVQPPGVPVGSVVRRLTPIETERLMGWPDEHTATDADGKAMPDSFRYRSCGNGMVASVVEFIARRLREAVEVGRFDG